MVKKRFWTIFSTFTALAVALVFVGCNNDSAQVSQTAQSFVNYVIRIETPITLDSEPSVEAGYVLYGYLNDTDKANSVVREHKAMLDEYKSRFDALKADEDARQSEKEQLALRVEFCAAVSGLPSEAELTSKDRASVSAALAVYQKLDEQSRNDAEVAQAYGLLIKIDDAVAIIEYNERLTEITLAADKFIKDVDAIGEVTADSANAIEDLEYEYQKLSEEVKAFDGVAEAKAKLDAAAAKCKQIKDESDVATFKQLAAELYPAETAVTLESERTIIRAEVAYSDMSDEAKAADGVALAWERVVAAREKYDALFAVAEQEKIQAFIEAANAVRTDIENVDITWYEALNNASNAYFALTFQSQQLDEVEEAFKRWDAAQTAFDKMGYTQIPMVEPHLLYSGDRPPHIVVQMEENMLKPLREFYGVASNAALSQYATAWLDVYVGGEYVGKAELQFSELGHIIVNTRVVDILKTMSASNSKVVSGASFSFALHFEDKAGAYIPSNKTAVSESKNTYTW